MIFCSTNEYFKPFWNVHEEIQGSENNALGLYKKMPSKNRKMPTQKAL